MEISFSEVDKQCLRKCHRECLNFGETFDSQIRDQLSWTLNDHCSTKNPWYEDKQFKQNRNHLRWIFKFVCLRQRDQEADG